jgi:hypothetical protein
VSRFLQYPYPLRYLIAYRLNKRIIGYSRDHYYHCILEATRLAHSLSKSRLSIIEFGVAGGNGLVEIERICDALSKKHGICYEIYGFDSGKGLPKPEDYRDIPYRWQEGFFTMDREALIKRLKTARLIIGEVSNTIDPFLRQNEIAPIGCIMFDLDYYSSTKAAFEIFSNDAPNKYLPRIQCYFDDIGTIDSVGVRLAISEFNKSNQRKKLENSLNLCFNRKTSGFGWQVYELHDFSHPEYAVPLIADDQLPLV